MNSHVAWTLAIIVGLAQMVQDINSYIPTMFVCTALICGAVERRKV